ncbi:MAG: DNA polymerase I [Candidatus Omnitrophica bacterium]|jgi:DNA polymerase-1|nr:DNA polymerase I [Candidatus Omnitrophota bacterium]
MAQDAIYLIDGTSICYRSFYAIRLSNSKGLPTGAVYGFYQTLKRIISKYNPVYIGICFDVSRKTFRQEKFKEYKIQRPPTPDDLKQQIPVIKKLINLLGITLIEKEGFEADDIIATISRKAISENLPAIIVSSDKDMYQLLDNDRVKVYEPVNDELLSEDSFKKEFGFPPQLIIDYLSLVGDSVDNVPGAKGIGKVGASKLIAEFGTVEKIFENIDGVSQKMKDILLREKENIFLSKDLITLRNCDINLTWQDLKIKERQARELYGLFQELEFKTLLKDVPAPSVNVKIDIKEDLPDDFGKTANKEKLFFYADEATAYILSLDRNCIYKTEINKIKGIIACNDIKKISYDFKSQMANLDSIEGLWFDVKIAAYLLNSALADYELSTLISHYLGELVSEVPAQVIPYFVSKLYEVFDKQLKEASLDKLFFDVEMPLTRVLYDMESCGIKINTDALYGLDKEVDAKLENSKKAIFKITGKEFNLNSPKQLSEVLFKDLKIPPVKKTKTGFSTGEEVLEKLSTQHEIAKFILEYRELNKLKTTYITPLIETVNLNAGILYAQFNQTATATGRLSGSSPNLQSIPAKGEFSAKLRSAFISSFNNGFILCADYSQIELRILAHFSDDEKLKEAFSKNIDVHRFTASLLFGKPAADISERERNLAKTVNFGITYGMSAYGLSRELNVGVTEADNFITDYFNRYPKVKNYIQAVYAQAQAEGYVKTILGRRRYLPDFKSNNLQIREFAARQAVNSPIQGSSADLIKLAMVKIHEESRKNNLKSKLIMQIHDELIFDVCPEELDELREIVKRNMEQSIKLSVPIEVKLKIGKNWGEVQ